MENFLSKEINLEEGTILKITLKYSILSNNKSVPNSTIDRERFSIDLTYKVMQNQLTCTIDDIYNVIVSIILQNNICRIQISRIKWHLISINNLTTKNFIARLPLRSCTGLLEQPLSSISSNYNYTFHLYQKKATPFKFSIKGVPMRIEDDPELSNILSDIGKIFTGKIPVNKNIENNGHLKYVKISNSKGYKSRLSDVFEEIEVAYPWGFQQMRTIKQEKPVKRKTNKRKT